MQPSTQAAAAATPAQLAAIDAAIARLQSLPGACLPILHAIQAELGFVPAEATARIAAALNLSRADVHGVLTYYHDFRSAPPGRHVLKICRAEACQAVGSDALEAHVAARHGAAVGATSEDGSLTVEAIYCLGNCALGPSVQLDGRLCGRVDAQRLDALLAAAKGSDA
ncbi:MAG: formate dehydrogenase subunit gamma [Planctomycetota bacterium]